jgi:NDP-sugar pyrophosphorylase family protein
MKAMLLAAGLGTRLKPWTDHHPKALAIVNGKSLLQRNIQYLQSFGIRDVIINVHHFGKQIRDTIAQSESWGSNISFSDETDAVLETGGGLKRAGWYFEKETSFVLMNVDILTDLRLDEMVSAHNSGSRLATLATTNRTTSRYFLFNEKNILCGWRNVNTQEEKITRPSTALEPKAFSGIHVISTEIFSWMKLPETRFSMVDLYLSLCGGHDILSFDHSNSKFIDVGNQESLVKAETLFR